MAVPDEVAGRIAVRLPYTPRDVEVGLDKSGRAKVSSGSGMTR